MAIGCLIGGVDMIANGALVAAEGIISGGGTNGIATLTLQERQHGFPYTGDLSPVLVKGARVQFWQGAGDGFYDFRFLDGTVEDAETLLGDAKSIHESRYTVACVDRNGQLDTIVVGKTTPLIIPAGSLASQVLALVLAFNSSAPTALDVNVRNIIGSTTLPAVTFTATKVRKALQLIMSAVKIVAPATDPRFVLRPTHPRTTAFGNPVLDIYDGKAVEPPTYFFGYGPVIGVNTQPTFGPVSYKENGHAVVNSVTGVAVGGTIRTKTNAASVARYQNDLSNDGTFDDVVTNLTNPDTTLSAEIQRQADTQADVQIALDIQTLQPLYPVTWVRYYNAKLARFRTGADLVVSEVRYKWDKPVRATEILGVAVPDPILFTVTLANRLPEAGEQGAQAADMQAVLAGAPSTPDRNKVVPQANNAPAFDTAHSDTGTAKVSGTGYSYPFVWHPVFKTDLQTRKLLASQPVKFTAGNTRAHGTGDVTYTVQTGGVGAEVSATLPITLAIGDVVRAYPAGTDPSDPLAITHVGIDPTL